MRLRMPARWSLVWSSEWSHDNRLHGALVVVVAFAVAVVWLLVVVPLVAATGRLLARWVQKLERHAATW